MNRYQSEPEYRSRNDVSQAKKKILILAPYYLPGYKAGGPIRSISNIVNNLSNDFIFLIITLDRDIGDQHPYSNILNNQWNILGKSRVYYLSPKSINIFKLSRLISSTPHDLLYLNSFFDPTFTLLPLLARKLGLLPSKPLLIAPRGEFALGALGLKTLKKISYIRFANFLKLYKDAIWHASTKLERDDIIRTLAVISSDVKIAVDLPGEIPSLPSLDFYINNSENRLKIIFLSRISPKKNLKYAISILSQVKMSTVFDIYGPIEDEDYWGECQRLIQQAPKNLTIRYCGLIKPTDVSQCFSEYDLFFFPTLGENYGHVIAEALLVGTPVLISDQTPWLNLAKIQLGWDFPLSNSSAFVKTVEDWAITNITHRYHLRLIRQERIKEKLFNPKILEDSRKLFRQIVDSRTN